MTPDLNKGEGASLVAAQAGTVTARGVVKCFGSNRVLDGIDLEVGSGEVVCLIGPSGSGKTTFLRCLNQLESIDDGLVEIDGV
ncbi:MAG: amino acid ABC transporter ATP-binding protein, partial [Solirubrobacteraceae bacterium]|nr:amino acid ABC transporter ATP-binding protein [Solirubrobacteraceae bacterium]